MRFHFSAVRRIARLDGVTPDIAQALIQSQAPIPDPFGASRPAMRRAILRTPFRARTESLAQNTLVLRRQSRWTGTSEASFQEQPDFRS